MTDEPLDLNEAKVVYRSLAYQPATWSRTYRVIVRSVNKVGEWSGGLDTYFPSDQYGWKWSHCPFQGLIGSRNRLKQHQGTQDWFWQNRQPRHYPKHCQTFDQRGSLQPDSAIQTVISSGKLGYHHGLVAVQSISYCWESRPPCPSDWDPSCLESCLPLLVLAFV